MLKPIAGLALAALLVGGALVADEAEHHHDHPAPEKLGQVSFGTSCAPRVDASFNRAVALLHSFAYTASHQTFAEVARDDPSCVMALWGEAMTHYHELWEPPVDSAAELHQGAEEIHRASNIARLGAGTTARERGYIAAMAQYYANTAPLPAKVRAQHYSNAMAALARDNPNDSEAQIFYALSLIATSPPTDRTLANQRRAAAILEPLWAREPRHPGLAHYLIHAYDSAELALRGLRPARAYALIAPSAPHAMHMPSHIFTRLGLWRDSVASNLAAETAAKVQGDVGEELHAMDYLTYAYLQLGSYNHAREVAAEVKVMPSLPASQFKIGYAANAVAVRTAVETRDWDAAGLLGLVPGSTPKVAMLVYWARALGHSRTQHPDLATADVDIKALQTCRDQLRVSGDDYWATQADALLLSTQAWRLHAAGDQAGALSKLRAAADEEDSLGKLPVTPGPIVPAREQLGELLLQLHQPRPALREFKAALTLAPGRRGALRGAIAAARELGDLREANRLSRLLTEEHLPISPRKA